MHKINVLLLLLDCVSDEPFLGALGRDDTALSLEINIFPLLLDCVFDDPFLGALGRGDTALALRIDVFLLLLDCVFDSLFLGAPGRRNTALELKDLLRGTRSTARPSRGGGMANFLIFLERTVNDCQFG